MTRLSLGEMIMYLPGSGRVLVWAIKQPIGQCRVFINNASEVMATVNVVSSHSHANR